jgi:HAD superfamily hydrolase (TIGR01450 family)
MKRVVILDWDGTTFLETDPLPHTSELLRECGALGAGVAFVTNNSSRKTDDYRSMLKRHELWSDNVSVVTSNLVAIDYLKTRLAVSRVFLLGNSSLREEFEEAGLVLDDIEPEAVVVGFDTSLVYDTLQTAHRLISEGHPFIATHADRVCPTKDGGLIDCGAIIAALSTSTGKTPTVVGKPEPPMADYLNRHVLEGCDVAVVVGDRQDTDGELAKKLGVPFVLVPPQVADKPDHRLVEKICDLMQG